MTYPSEIGMDTDVHNSDSLEPLGDTESIHNT